MLGLVSAKACFSSVQNQRGMLGLVSAKTCFGSVHTSEGVVLGVVPVGFS